jgi:hypothetical protein
MRIPMTALGVDELRESFQTSAITKLLVGALVSTLA